MRNALAQTAGDRAKAPETLETDETTPQDKLRRYGLRASRAAKAAVPGSDSWHRAQVGVPSNLRAAVVQVGLGLFVVAVAALHRLHFFRMWILRL